MSALLSPQAWWQRLRRAWMLQHLADPHYRFMWEPAPPGEWVALDCETTGLNVRSDEIIAISAVRIQGQRILTSQRLELLVRPEQVVPGASIRVHRLRGQDVAGGLAVRDAVAQLLHFIGSRPLVGYYLEFDVAMLNRVLFQMLGVSLPQPQIEVSALYYDYKFGQLQPQLQERGIDLRFATLMQDLQLPEREAHNALNDAVMAAMAFIKLRQLLQKQ